MSARAILQRELLQQSRRPAGAWLRVAAAALAGAGALAILGGTSASARGGTLPGQVAFTGLSIFVFTLCLFEGVRQTADALASEKRDGTLGLLLLTHLRGVDVVAGKLAAGSLGSIYGLLAVFPTMSFALPYGGVTAGEFWRTQLVLLVALFLALAVGLWASARSREAGAALITGLSWIAGLVLIPVVVEFLLSRGSWPNPSPAVALFLARAGNYAADPFRFWLTLACIVCLAGGFLAAAGRRVSRSWQEEERPATLADLEQPPVVERWAPEGEPVWTEDLATYRSATAEAARPSRDLINQDPATWLAAWVPQNRFLGGAAIFLLGIGAFGNFLLFPFVGASVAQAGPAVAITSLTGLLPWLLLAYVACRPMLESRRAGEFELLLSTPLPPDDIVRAQWQALWLQFRGPLVAVALLLGIYAMFAVSAILTTGFASNTWTFPVRQVISGILRVAQGLAVCRLGLFFGLKSPTLFGAILRCLSLGVFPVWLGNAIISILVAGLVPSLGGPFGVFTVQFFADILALAYAAYLIHWSQRQLVTGFRELAATRAG